jgi:hypothetical protein
MGNICKTTKNDISVYLSENILINYLSYYDLLISYDSVLYRKYYYFYPSQIITYYEKKKIKHKLIQVALFNLAQIIVKNIKLINLDYDDYIHIVCMISRYLFCIEFNIDFIPPTYSDYTLKLSCDDNYFNTKIDKLVKDNKKVKDFIIEVNNIINPDTKTIISFNTKNECEYALLENNFAIKMINNIYKNKSKIIELLQVIYKDILEHKKLKL